MTPLVIGVNVNEGMMREPNPHVPWTPEEIGDDVAACVAAGASVVHFHARTAGGRPDHSVERYVATNRAIRARCHALLAPSLANGPGFDVQARLAPVTQAPADARPDFLTMDMGCACMDPWDPEAVRFRSTDRVIVNDTATQLRLFAAARDHALTPWMATFGIGWTRVIAAHLVAGEVAGRAVVQLVLGGPEFLPAHPATPAGLDAHLRFLPDHDLAWIVSAHRADVLDIAEDVIGRGGHIAVGTGDHPHVERGMPSNAELVAAVADLARRFGREPATPRQARRILGVPSPADAHV